MKSWMAVALWLALAATSASAAGDSRHMSRAKDLIADEQWARAIVELQAAAADRTEPNRDEAMYWLAQSEHETGDLAAAVQTLARLEREFPSSRWVRPGRSLRVEIAQEMRRDDVLWMIAAPPAPPAPPPSPAAPAPTPMAARPGWSSTRPTPAPAAVVPVAAHAMPPAPLTPAAVPPPPGPPTAPPALEGRYWFEGLPADTDLRIEALGGLMDTHADRVIPLLKDIALDPKQPGEASRAVFVLARSPRPEARTTMYEVARRGPEPARIAAIREIGRFDGPSVTGELMQVYADATTPQVKRQVVVSLAARADNASLLHIAQTESDVLVRNTAIMTLGRSAPRPELHALYLQAPLASRAAVLAALFMARDDDELIRIAQTEKDKTLRDKARQQLRVLATPKALKFLADNP